jgi:prephenate dehydrogenase
MINQLENDPDFTIASFGSESGEFSATLRGLRVAILGLGLMGGSIAMALRGRCSELLGVDTGAETLALAEQISLCDRLAIDPAVLLPEADLIILAVPVKTILKYLEDLPNLTPGSPIVMDLGSTKARIVRAMAALPERFDPIGGHPMCGKERSSLVEAEAVLYQNASFALTPLPRTSKRARGLAENLVKFLGANPVWLNETTHDRWVSATSHTPFLIANALAAVTPLEVAALIGPGYRSTTRIATTPSSVMMDILATNRENVLDSLARFRLQIDHLETLLHTDDLAGLDSALSAGSARQKQLLLTAER